MLLHFQRQLGSDCIAGTQIWSAENISTLLVMRNHSLKVETNPLGLAIIARPGILLQLDRMQ